MSRVTRAITIVFILFAADFDAEALNVPQVQWQQILKSDTESTCNSAIFDPNGGFVLTGALVSHPGSVLQAIHTDPNGSVGWWITDGASDRTVSGQCVIRCAEGGYLIAGKVHVFTSMSDFDVYLLRIDDDGKILWRRSYGGVQPDVANCVRQMPDGGFAIAGSTFSYSHGRMDALLLVTDPNGNEIFRKSYGGKMDDCANSLALTPDGGFLLVGYTESYGQGDDDIYLLRVDSAGNELWHDTYGDQYSDSASCIEGLPDGGYVIAGRMTTSSPGDSDFWFMKLNAQFQFSFGRVFGGPQYEQCHCVRRCADGGFLLAGTIGQGVASDIMLIKTDAGGNKLWQKTCGGSSTDVATAVLQCPDSGYAVLGNTMCYGLYDSFAGFILKADTDGLVAGDFDFDSVVDVRDFSIFAASWGSQALEARYNPACNIGAAADERIDAADLRAMAENWLHGK